MMVISSGKLSGFRQPNNAVTTFQVERTLAMAHPKVQSYWGDVEAHAHLPEVQQLIREEIRNGTVRVRTTPDGGIRVMPTGEVKSKELAPMEPQRAKFQNRGTSWPTPVRRGRLAQR
jgi:hypothetical protein